MRGSLHTPEQAVLSELLRERRERAGLSQAELANRIGRPQSFVSRIESRDSRVDLVELNGICAALEVSLTTFVRTFEQRLQQSTT